VDKTMVIGEVRVTTKTKTDPQTVLPTKHTK
jgi:hypothetical protein